MHSMFPQTSRQSTSHFPPPPFKPGNLVRFREDVMIVDWKQTGVDMRDIVWCFWYEGNERLRIPFATRTLSAATEPDPER
jgi:hypothetical protein